MPIRRELRKFYGPHWRSYRLILIAIAQNRCARCNRQLPSPRLSAAHITHDPRSSEVRVLCFPCHNRHDAGHRLAIRRRNRARRYGQLWLFPEVEEIPGWIVIRRNVDMRRAARIAQGRMFE